VSFRVTRDEPKDTGADIGSAIDNQGRLSGVDDLAIKKIGKTALLAIWKVILQIAKTFIDNALVTPAPVFDGEFSLTV